MAEYLIYFTAATMTLSCCSLKTCCCMETGASPPACQCHLPFASDSSILLACSCHTHQLLICCFKYPQKKINSIQPVVWERFSNCVSLGWDSEPFHACATSVKRDLIDSDGTKYLKVQIWNILSPRCCALPLQKASTWARRILASECSKKFDTGTIKLNLLKVGQCPGFHKR